MPERTLRYSVSRSLPRIIVVGHRAPALATSELTGSMTVNDDAFALSVPRLCVVLVRRCLSWILACCRVAIDGQSHHEAMWIVHLVGSDEPGPIGANVSCALPVSQVPTRWSCPVRSVMSFTMQEPATWRRPPQPRPMLVRRSEVQPTS
jgi:hypothetical protein